MLAYDAVIVGAGPIGGQVAKTIAQEGYTVAIFEEHKQIGTPLRCAGLVTSRVFSSLDFPPSHVVQNEIKGAHIHSPSGNLLTIGGDKIHALVIDRSIFDKEINKQAQEKGAEIFLENKIIAAQAHKGYINLKATKNEVKCKLLIGADGPHSKIRDCFSFPQPLEFLQGIGAEITNVSLNPDFVEIFVGNNIAPGFFAWLIPLNKQGTAARIGLCIEPNSPYPPKHYFSKLLKNKSLSAFFHDIKITKRIGGVVPLGPLKKTFDSHVLLVGDAAAQVKPTSGGGIFPGLVCAKHCSSVAIEALSKNNFNLNLLKKYHKQWVENIGRELTLGMRFRSVFKSLSDTQLDYYIDKFQNKTLTDIISLHGDIDYPSKLVKPLLKKSPSFLRFLPKMIKN
jgi:geranylgeranyl reductase family protein